MRDHLPPAESLALLHRLRDSLDRDHYEGWEVAEITTALFSILETTLTTTPSMHGDNHPMPGVCRRCEGEEYVLTKIHEMVGRYLTDIPGVTDEAQTTAEGAPTYAG